MTISNFDTARELIPILWELTKKEKRCSFNISTSNNEISIGVFVGKKSKLFCRNSKLMLMRELHHFIEDCKSYFKL
jgi:hypothetical protein